jgi:S-adenosyl methyltransferase
VRPASPGGVGLVRVRARIGQPVRIVPVSRIVYVDNDVQVMTFARALLASENVGCVEEDIREPEKVIEEAAATLDFSQPVAMMLLRILGHITNDSEAHSIVTRLMAQVPSGSYLVLSDGTNVINGTAGEAAQRNYNLSGTMPS